jgi:AraC-like DNA-binding protein
VAYREIKPHPGLADLLVCTWERTVPRSGGRRAQRVVPDGSVDLVWHGGALKVAGPDTEPFMSPLEPGATVVGLRFRPGVAGAALGIPASELLNARVALDDVWPRLGAELEERIGLAADATERRRILEGAVLARRAQSDGIDLAVLDAVGWLGDPGVHVRNVSNRLGLSNRQLLRRFRVAIGYGPKMLDRVMRFQRFLTRAGAVARGDETLAGLAFELGYSDQAHLTRECVQLSGLTPAALVQAWHPPPVRRDELELALR